MSIFRTGRVDIVSNERDTPVKSQDFPDMPCCAVITSWDDNKTMNVERCWYLVVWASFRVRGVTVRLVHRFCYTLGTPEKLLQIGTRVAFTLERLFARV